MAKEITVPEVSEGVTEGTVISLAVSEGDTVEADQTLLELETDKAVVALPAPFDGRITKILVGEGDTAKVGQAVMEGEPADGGGKQPEQKKEPERREPPAEEEPERKEPPEKKDEPERKEPPSEEEPERKEPPAEDDEPERREPPRRDDPLPPSPGAAPPRPADDDPVDLHTVRTGDRVAPAAPSIRRLARELGVDIHQVQGTGPGGRIGEDDVRGFVRGTMQRITGGGPAPSGEFPGLHAQRPLPDFSKWGGVSVEPLSKVRQITADAMSYAWSTIPMVTQEDRADVTDLEAFRRDANRKAEPEAKLTMTSILLKVCAAALRAFPQFNSSVDLARKELILKDYVHIGVAVDTPGGLLVPVVRDCDRKGLAELAGELNATAEKTRERRISPADMEGGTFTISNLGGIGGTSFTPLVYAPQVAILGVSRASTEPVWDGEAFRPRQVMPLSLTYDHRVIDGADGARFLRWICEAVERPLNLLMKGSA